MIRTLYKTGLGELLQDQQGTLKMLEPFALFDRVSQPGLLLEGMNEMIACAFHEDFRQQARQEHKRWRENKEADGWRAPKRGEDRDDENKIHPDLVRWKELAEGSKQYNRQSCRQIPLILASVGFEVYRQNPDAG